MRGTDRGRNGGRRPPRVADQAGHTLRGAASAPSGRGDDGLLVVSGIRHVMTVLEELENGLLEDVTALEAYACEGGCFGSPLAVRGPPRRSPPLGAGARPPSRRPWRRRPAPGRLPREAVAARCRHGRRAPPSLRGPARHPAGPGHGAAIQKLGSLQAVTRSLPGRDCGACGAPTCAALAEDVVMERSGIEFCPYIACEKEEADS